MLEKYMVMLKEHRLVAAGFGAIVMALGAFWLLQQPSQAETTALLEVPSSETTVSSSSPKTSSSETSVSSSILVDVKGAVKKEGLYELETDARVNDAIRAAGGFTEQADKKSVNLAQKLTDEAVVYVASQGEEVSVVNQTGAPTTDGTTSETTDKVNLNTATIADLTTISGIGEKRASDIIAYRDSNGGFKSVDDLNNVSGIGDKTLENMRPYVTVD